MDRNRNRTGTGRGRRLAVRIVAAAVAVALTATGVYFGFFAGTGPLEVRTALVSRQDISSRMLLTAEIQPGRKQETYAVQQTVDEVLVEAGDRVTAGQLLVTFDVSLLEQAVADADEARRTAEDAVAATKKAISAAKKETAAANATLEANLSELSASLSKVIADLESQLGVEPTEEQLATLKSFSDSLSAVLTLLSNSSLGAGLDPTATYQSALAQSQAAVTQAERAVKMAQRQLDAALREIRAEFAGIVVDVGAASGSVGGIGSLTGSLSGSPIVRIYDDSTLTGFVRVNRYDAARLQEGQSVLYRQDDREYTGRIVRKGLVAKNVTSTSGIEPMIEIEMSIEGISPGELTIGFTLDAEITTAVRTDVLAIPAEALKKDKDGYYVYVVVDGAAVRHAVTPGIQSDEDAEILSGLDEGERVVLSPSNALSEGGKVRWSE